MTRNSVPERARRLLRDHARALDRLELVSRSSGTVPGVGRRRGSRTGSSVDFADYRKYNSGDDVRYVDWNIYARLRKLFLRQFRAESELAVHLLLDTSKSMDFGARNKLRFAADLAAALSYVALGRQDRVGLATFSDRLHQVLPPQRGSRQLPRVLSLLDSARPEGASDFDHAFRAYPAQASSRGLLVVLSDCFCAQGYQTALRCLAFAGFEVVVIRVLADEELFPSFDDEAVELRDLENADAPGLTVEHDTLERYRREMDTHSRTLAAFCASVGVPFVQTTSSLTFEELTYRLLRVGIWRNR
jgi:uncharacterized protein (DUF58 family)